MNDTLEYIYKKQPQASQYTYEERLFHDIYIYMKSGYEYEERI